MRYFFLLAALIVTPCHAWDVGQSKNRMTDRVETFATVSSDGAMLLVSCVNGSVQPRLTFDSPTIGWGDVGVSYRFDDGPEVPRIASVSRDSGDMYIWHLDHAEALANLRKGKRLRISIGKTFYDFDLTGGQRLPAIDCR
jgi:hypothetical protein